MNPSKKISLERLYQKIESLIAEYNSKLPEKGNIDLVPKEEDQKRLFENFKIMHADIKSTKKAQRLAMK